MEDTNKWKLGARHTQVILYAITMYSVMCGGVCSNVAIVYMTNRNDTNSSVLFDWDKEIIGYMPSSQLVGDIIVQLSISSIIHKFGGKIFITISLGGTALLLLLTPSLVQMADWIGMCFSSLLLGLFCGIYFPGLQTLLGKWAPVCERTRMGLFAYIGLNMSYIITFPLAGYITSSFDWKSAFYFYGCQNIICCIFWIWLAANSPSEHKSISNVEKDLILTSLEQTEDEKPQNTPWMSILTSKPFWAILLTQTGELWGYFVLSYEMLSFLQNAVGTNLLESGIYSSLGFALAIITGLIASWLLDYLLIKKYFNLTQLRMIFNTIGTWGPALCFLILSFTPTEAIITIVILTILITGLDSINCCGYLMNFVDLSPRYSGNLYCVSIVFSDFITLFAPYIHGKLLNDLTDVGQWRKVLLLAGAMYFFGNVVFLIFGSAEKQSWDNYEENSAKGEKIEDDVENCNPNEKMLIPST